MTSCKSSNDASVTYSCWVWPLYEDTQVVMWPLIGLFVTTFCVMLLFCEDLKVVNRRSYEHFVKISWQLLMRSRAVIWHPGDYFVTSYCDEWQLFDGWKIIFGRLVDASVKMFDQSDDFATVTESLYDDLETTLRQASMKGQLYNNSMTALQILIRRPCDHAVSCDYTGTTLGAENKRSPIWQICRHRWHRNLS